MHYIPIIVFTVLMFTIAHISIFKIRNRAMSYTVLATFYLKLILIIYHCYVNHLPFTGDDATAFHLISAELANKLRDNEYVEITFSGWHLYTTSIGFLYYVFGTYEFIPLLVNTTLSVLIIKIIYSITLSISKNKKTAVASGMISALFPNFIFGSVLNLREMPIIFFTSLGFYFFLKWLDDAKLRNVMTAILLTMTAGVMHRGIVFTVFVYGLIYCIYSPKLKKWSILSFRSVISVAIISGLIAVYGNYFEMDKNIDGLNTSMGAESNARAAYLPNMNPGSTVDLIVYAPIRIIYFLVKPFPWDITSYIDILGVLDAFIYLFFIFFAIRFLRHMKKHDQALFLTILLIIIIEFTVFSWGTLNYGTAIRHRLKFIWLTVPIISIGYSMGRERIKKLKVSYSRMF